MRPLLAATLLLLLSQAVCGEPLVETDEGNLFFKVDEGYTINFEVANTVQVGLNDILDRISTQESSLSSLDDRVSAVEAKTASDLNTRIASV